MHNLLYIVTGMAPVFLGTYVNEPSCQNAIREIYTLQMNPANQRLPEIEKAVDLKIQLQKNYICVPQQKR